MVFIRSKPKPSKTRRKMSTSIYIITGLINGVALIGLWWSGKWNIIIWEDYNYYGTTSSSSSLSHTKNTSNYAPSLEVVALPVPTNTNMSSLSSSHQQQHYQGHDSSSSSSSSSPITYEVCFITSVFAKSPEYGDRPPTVKDFQQTYPTIFAFYAYTNLPNNQLDAPGWTIRENLALNQYKRYITQSRWAKFMVWTDPIIQQSCQCIFYIDGFCQPKLKHANWYRSIAKNLATNRSTFGIAQNKHLFTKGILHELDRIVTKQKDVIENVNATLQWLYNQSDFHENCTMYENHYIAYNPKSIYFQQASQFFWNHYSLEQDSWRDQPLWCHTLDKYHISPTPLGNPKALFVEKWKHLAKGGHRYDKTNENDAI